MEQKNNKRGFFQRKKSNKQSNRNSHTRGKGSQHNRGERSEALITLTKKKSSQARVVQRTSFPEGAIPDISRPKLDENQLAVKDNATSLPRVYTDIYDEHSAQIVSFDEALELLKKRENLAEDESIMYAGAGNFAVIKTEGSGKNAKQVVVRKIEFEKKHEEDNWRKDMRFEIPSLYEPNPEPLSTLYTDEEIAQFKLKR